MLHTRALYVLYGRWLGSVVALWRCRHSGDICQAAEVLWSEIAGLPSRRYAVCRTTHGPFVCSRRGWGLELHLQRMNLCVCVCVCVCACVVLVD